MTTPHIDHVSHPYPSLPLPRESKLIRVLDVYSSTRPDESDTSIQCDLRIINLDSEDCPPFAALSYVWGVAAREGHFITCGGYEVKVTPNCHSALRHLKEKLGDFTIWIDAICIDQNNDGEKTNQISLMGDIFSKAETMYVWLGEGNDATNRALAYLKSAGYLRYFFRHHDTVDDALRKPRHWIAVWSAFVSCFHLPMTIFRSSRKGLYQEIPNIGRVHTRDSGAVQATYDDMNTLLDKDWVRRIWTYQEILLASNPVVVCGDYHLPWARFSLGVIFLEYSGLNHRRNYPIIAILNTWAQIASIRDHVVSSDTITSAHVQSSSGEEIPQTILQKYREFVMDVSRRIVRLRDLNYWCMFFCAIIIPSILTVWMFTMLFNTEATDFSDFAGLVLHASILPAFVALIGFFLFAFVVSFIVYIGSRPLEYPTMSTDPLAQNERIDLVDGICSRKSKEKKDKAIGVQAILQRLSKTALLPIDNAQPLEHIYKQLCIKLMEVTGSIQFLLPASLNNFPEQPSWVPDWSADFDSFWLKPTLFMDIPTTSTPGSRASWKFNPTEDKLVLQGCQMCTVAECFNFRETFNTYDPSQKDLHLENIRSILQWAHILQRKDKTISMILEQMNGYNALPRNSERRINTWKLFMCAKQSLTPEKILSILESKSSALDSSHGFRSLITGRAEARIVLSTQISISNCLAKKGITVFSTKNWLENPLYIQLTENMERSNLFPGTLVNLRTGVGSGNVRVGDAVALIAGLSSPLIIRHEGTLTRIISPAAVHGVETEVYWYHSCEKQDLEEFILS